MIFILILIKLYKKKFEFNNTTYLYKILEWGVLVTYICMEMIGPIITKLVKILQ